MIVGDIMSKDPLYVEERSFVTKARQLIRDNHLRGLPVVDDEGNVVGAVTSQEMLKITSTRSDVTVAGFTQEIPQTTEDMELKEAARLLLTGKYAILPVIQSGEYRRLIGVVSPVDIFKNINPDEIPDRRVGDVMVASVTTCHPRDLVTKVWDKLTESDFTGLPVVGDNRKPLGMITRFDILKRGGARVGKTERVRSKDVIRVEKLMKTPLYSVGSEDTLHNAIEVMSKRGIGRISVVDDGKLVGIVDRYDMIRSYLGEG